MSPLVHDGLVASAQVAVVLAGGWGASAALRRSSAATRHHAWALAVLAALAVPCVGLVVPGVPWATSVEAPGVEQVLTEALRPTVAAIGAHASPAAPFADPAWSTWVVAAWTVGATLVGLRFARAWFLAWRLGRRAVPTADERWLTACRVAAARLGLAQDVQLARSAEIGTPITLGLLRPRVLLPDAAEGWSAERLNAVLLHELAHVYRRDLAVQGAAQLLCALCWYNPLAWLAAARLREERELAADDRVLAAGVRPSSYAADLVAIARELVPDAIADGAAGMAESPTVARVMHILDPAAPRASIGGHARAAMWAFALVGVVGTAAAAPGDPALKDDKVRNTGKPAATLVGSVYTVIENPEPWPPVPDDPLFLPRVETALQSNLRDLQRCYETRLDARPGLGGDMAMEYVISAAGAFEDGCLASDEVLDSKLGDCVRDLTVHTAYPALPDAQGPSRAVTVTFHFAPR